ncbi:MAG: DUF5719 family protein [Nocardiopsaceae bacterium]|nr:DUF5719 family protein [Nocardiopsaceae bacterium]
MKLIVESRFALLGLVMVALTALFGVAFATRSAGTDAGALERDPVAAQVESALRVCPPPQGDDRVSDIGAFTLSAKEDEGTLIAEENTAAAAPVGGKGEKTGRLWSTDVGEAERHTVVRADGTLAAGLDVTQTTIGADDPYATMVRCTEPGVSTWFAAPGGDDLEELRLLLANVDDAAATVNVDLYATDGPAFSSDTRGISVDAHGEAEVDLTELIESTGAVAVHVRTNAGRVASSLFAERTGAGSDWVPPTDRPAKKQVIAGVPKGKGVRRLIVATPGDEPATADVKVYTPDGEAELDGLEGLSVPPAASATLSLEGALGKEPGTVVVEADRPVVVGVAMDRSSGEDTAYAATAPSLGSSAHNTAVLPGNPADTATELVFGALDGDATAVITPVFADGENGDPVKVEVPAGTTATQEMENPGEPYALLVEVPDDSDPVYAGQVLTQGSGGGRATAAHPVMPALDQVALPPVSDTLTSVVP